LCTYFDTGMGMICLLHAGGAAGGHLRRHGVRVDAGALRGRGRAAGRRHQRVARPDRIPGRRRALCAAPHFMTGSMQGPVPNWRMPMIMGHGQAALQGSCKHYKQYCAFTQVLQQAYMQQNEVFGRLHDCFAGVLASGPVRCAQSSRPCAAHTEAAPPASVDYQTGAYSGSMGGSQWLCGGWRSRRPGGGRRSAAARAPAPAPGRAARTRRLPSRAPTPTGWRRPSGRSSRRAPACTGCGRARWWPRPSRGRAPWRRVPGSPAGRALRRRAFRAARAATGTYGSVLHCAGLRRCVAHPLETHGPGPQNSGRMKMPECTQRRRPRALVAPASGQLSSLPATEMLCGGPLPVR